MTDSGAQPSDPTYRAALFARIRAALGRESATPPPQPLPIDEPIVRTVRDDQDLVAVFCEHAEQVGMKPRRTSAADLQHTLEDLLTTLGTRRATVSIVPGALLDAAAAALSTRNIERVDWRAAEGLEPDYDVDAGITDVALAVAESGTLVYRSGQEHSRGTAFVPPMHIALVRARDIVPDLIDAMPRLAAQPTDLPSATLLITGPSKTADIEGVLVKGVHGPQDVHILLVQDA
jgi:L-lactate dehydrogenase complex protein LldG